MKPPRASRLALLLGGLVLLSIVGVALLAWRRHSSETNLEKKLAASADAGPRIFVAKSSVTPGERTVTLPGDVRAFNQATLYAKTAGYLKSIAVDKGDSVQRNQVLGVIESPETDQQVAAAESDLAVKQRDAARARELGPSGVISAQDVDRAETALRVSQAGLARVRALQGYQTLRAPFDGVVTARYVDPGALVQGQVAVVDVADPRRVKISVSVGQDVAPFLKLKDRATVWQDERPDIKIDAQVTRVSSALDPRTRTMICEVWLDNEKYNLYPGTFVHVSLHVRVPPAPTVPADAIFTRADQHYVAVVEGNVARFRKVEMGLNDGKVAQIRSGLNGEEQVALNFPSELDDGAKVQPMTPKAPAAPSQH